MGLALKSMGGEKGDAKEEEYLLSIFLIICWFCRKYFRKKQLIVNSEIRVDVVRNWWFRSADLDNGQQYRQAEILTENILVF